MSTYKERLAERKKRYREKAKKLHAEAESQFETSRQATELVETTHYFNDIEVWGRLAKFCADNEILTKGQPIFVRGRIDHDSWENSEGKKRSRLKLVATHIEALATRETATAGVTADSSSYAVDPVVNEDDLPF